MNSHRAPLRLNRRTLIVACALGAVGRRAAAQSPQQTDPWPELASQIFDGRQLQDGGRIIAIDAPDRAEDAALVPVTLRMLLEAQDTRHVRHVTLVIDQNPSPLAAVFSPGVGSGMRVLSTLVRVDSYTNLHAVAELDDGQLYTAQRFVKAAGGCSAPAVKEDADGIPPGTMRLRQFAAGPDKNPDLREVQLMIRHPNNTGMQMDQLTRLYTPAFFIRSVGIWQGNDKLLTVEGGISISQNPEFRFNYRPNGATALRARAEDSKGHLYTQEWPIADL